MARPFDSILDRPFTFVDCGARGTTRHPLVQAFRQPQYIGFEPDVAECARLQSSARSGYRYFPVAAGARHERRPLHLTKNPACSSLLAPNRALLQRYLKLGDMFEVTASTDVAVVALDDYLPAHGIDRIDALELDAQGAELDILHGARRLLATTLTVQVEVEFTPLYVGQPLFGDVDAFLRQEGFELFDLSRYHVRRANWPSERLTRGQLLWGHAVYLKDATRLSGASDRAMLSAVAWLLGFPDFAFDVLSDTLAHQSGEFEKRDLEQLEITRRRLLKARERGPLLALARWFERSPLRTPFHKTANAVGGLRDAAVSARRAGQYVWKD